MGRFPDRNEIKLKTLQAIEMFMQKDSELLQNVVHERTIAAKIAHYLELKFPEWTTDIEYNKMMGKEVKELEGIKACRKRRGTNRIYPDIIVHHRGIKYDNLLVIELKKTNLNPKCDILKLRLLTSPKGEFRYHLGLFLELKKDKTIPRWFAGGEEI